MPFIIDAHEDLAYSSLCYNRDYRRSAVEIRQIEKNNGTPCDNGDALLGWPDFQHGQVAVVFSTIFIMPHRFNTGTWSKREYKDFDEAHQQYHEQFDLYRRLAGNNPDLFQIITNGKELQQVVSPWLKQAASFPNLTHPVGLVYLMEGAEGIRHPSELEEYWEMGLRMMGLVWGGGRLCGGTFEKGKFTREGFAMLETMQSLGYALDITHMSEESGLQALDHYQGPILASHANARALLKNPPNDRHLSDQTIRLLLERDGILGVLPYNKFLVSGWKPGDDRQAITLHTVADHIDHICQLAGNAQHVGFGTDFDGGFGWPDVPLELDTIADLQKIVPVLKGRGYSGTDIEDILGRNWLRFLERILPAS